MSIQRHLKVFTALAFLKLRSPDIVWYQWIYPTVLFGLGYFGFSWCCEEMIVVDGANIIKDVNVLMGILVGFYIAALAAISSFGNQDLDRQMSGRSVKLIRVRQGKKEAEILTRRRFLAVLFGYCASLSILLYIFGVVEIHVMIGETTKPWLRVFLEVSREISRALYTWMLCSLLVVTLLGLHYLVERMHRP